MCCVQPDIRDDRMAMDCVPLHTQRAPQHILGFVMLEGVVPWHQRYRASAVLLCWGATSRLANCDALICKSGNQPSLNIGAPHCIGRQVSVDSTASTVLPKRETPVGTFVGSRDRTACSWGFAWRAPVYWQTAPRRGFAALWPQICSAGSTTVTSRPVRRVAMAVGQATWS